MNLPVFDLPIPPLGFDIPILMHPPIVHFAIVIPVFILILELINVFMKRRGLTITTFIFFTLLIVIYFAAFVTGKTDGTETWDLLTKAGQADLKEHKLIGIYLMLSTVIVMFAKLFSMALRKWWMKLIYLLILVGFVAAVLYQGKEGGELVYKHGANNERVQELGEEVFDLQEELDEIKEASEEDTVQEKEIKSEKTTPVSEEKKPEATEHESPTENSTPAQTKPEEESKPEATESSEETKADVGTEAQSVKEEVKEAAKSVSDTVKSLTDKATDMAKETFETTKEAVMPASNTSDATKGSHE